MPELDRTDPRVGLLLLVVTLACLVVTVGIMYGGVWP